MSTEGIKLATDLWVAKEREAAEKGEWIDYSFCAHCLNFYPMKKHTDADAVAHFRGGELELLTFFARQRTSCVGVIGQCRECFNILSRTGKYPLAKLNGEEAKWLAQWINGGGLTTLL